VEPEAELYKPAAHCEHEDCPVLAWKVPAAHEVQLVAVPAAYLPAAQGVQAPGPAALLYEPALQFAQVEAPVAA